MKKRRKKTPDKRTDPTQTGAIRKRFESEFVQRFKELKRRIRKLIVEDDSFGLKENRPQSILGIALNARDKGCVLATVDQKNVVDTVHQLQSEIRPQDLLKLEDHIHVTARYGFTAPIDQRKIREAVQDAGSPSATVGQLGLFQNDDADVLKFSIQSEDLEKLHAELAQFPSPQTHPNYDPHLTVAYLKSGTGWRYLFVTEINGEPLEFSDFELSLPGGEKSVIPVSPTANARFQFLTDEGKLKAFRLWLALQMNDIFMLDAAERLPDTFWYEYAVLGYQKGAGRAFEDTQKRAREAFGGKDVLAGFAGTREEFLRQSFAHPVSIERIKLLAGRVFTELQGISGAMDIILTRTLTDGLTQGLSPWVVARDILKNVDGIDKNRARTMVRSELIRAHAEGQLDTLDRLGVEEVGAMVEWSTTGDHKVCPRCRPLNGVVLKIQEARGMIPRHPNCRCAWTPANVGEPLTRKITTGQTVKQQRSQAEIQRALDRSVAAEIPKKSDRPLSKQKQLTSWTGADTEVSKVRPKSILDGPIDNKFNPNQPRDSRGRFGSGGGGGGGVTVTGYHGTHQRTAEIIQEEGFKSKPDGSNYYGEGVYFVIGDEDEPSKTDFYGEKQFKSAIELKNPYVHEEHTEFEEPNHLPPIGMPGDPLRPEIVKRVEEQNIPRAAALTQILKERGYDGVISWEYGQKIAVVFDPQESIKETVLINTVIDSVTNAQTARKLAANANWYATTATTR